MHKIQRNIAAQFVRKCVCRIKCRESVDSKLELPLQAAVTARISRGFMGPYAESSLEARVLCNGTRTSVLKLFKPRPLWHYTFFIRTIL